MKFQGLLYDVLLNNHSVAKYVKEDGMIVIQIEKDGEKVEKYEAKEFESQEDFEDYIDSLVPPAMDMGGSAGALYLIMSDLEGEVIPF